MLQPLIHAAYRNSLPAGSSDTSPARRLKVNLNPLPPQAFSSSSGLAARNLGPQCSFPCILLVIRSYSSLHFLLLPYSLSFCPGSGSLLSLLISEGELSPAFKTYPLVCFQILYQFFLSPSFSASDLRTIGFPLLRNSYPNPTLHSGHYPSCQSLAHSSDFL